MRVLLACCLCLISLSAQAADAPRRIISLGGDITEIVYALGFGDQVVGTDTTSMHPVAAQSLPQLGYVRALSAEGIASLSPTLVLAAAEAGPPPAIATTRKLGINVLQMQAARSPDGIISKIKSVAAALGATDQGDALIASIAPAMTQLPVRAETAPALLFVLQSQGHALMAAGTNTAADAAIQLAGGKNVLADLQGYKPINGAYIASRQIDYVLVMENTLQMIGGVEALKSHPALINSDAIKNGNIIVIDSVALLGFGPRTPDALLTLAHQIGTK